MLSTIARPSMTARSAAVISPSLGLIVPAPAPCACGTASLSIHSQAPTTPAAPTCCERHTITPLADVTSTTKNSSVHAPTFTCNVRPADPAVVTVDRHSTVENSVATLPSWQQPQPNFAGFNLAAVAPTAEL